MALSSKVRRIFAKRELVLATAKTQRNVIVRLYEPQKYRKDWLVEYEIEGLEHPKSIFKHRAIQIDAIGALQQALELLAVELRVSAAHKKGQLYWLEPGDDYGLPPPDKFKDL